MTLTQALPPAQADAPAATSPAWRTGGWLRDLGPAFFSDVAPSALPGLHWVARSEALADELGLGAWVQTDAALHLLGAMPCRRARRRWPASTAATSSASGPASWATAARCCWARSTPPAG